MIVLLELSTDLLEVGLRIKLVDHRTDVLGSNVHVFEDSVEHNELCILASFSDYVEYFLFTVAEGYEDFVFHDVYSCFKRV